MAWTSPKTFIPELGLTSAELNTHIRDNQIEFAAAKATAAGQLLWTAGQNSVAMRAPVTGYRANVETTTSTTPVSLSFPTVTAAHGGTILCVFAARMFVSAGPANTINCGPEIVGSGLSGHVATVGRAIRYSGTGGLSRYSGHHMYYNVSTSLTGFRLMHWTSNAASTGEFGARLLLVIPM